MGPLRISKAGGDAFCPHRCARQVAGRAAEQVSTKNGQGPPLPFTLSSVRPSSRPPPFLTLLLSRVGRNISNAPVPVFPPALLSAGKIPPKREKKGRGKERAKKCRYALWENSFGRRIDESRTRMDSLSRACDACGKSSNVSMIGSSGLIIRDRRRDSRVWRFRAASRARTNASDAQRRFVPLAGHSGALRRRSSVALTDFFESDCAGQSHTRASNASGERGREDY